MHVFRKLTTGLFLLVVCLLVLLVVLSPVDVYAIKDAPPTPTPGGGIDVSPTNLPSLDAPQVWLRQRAISSFVAAWSPDGRYIAASGSGDDIQLYDAATGEVTQTFIETDQVVWALAWSPDGQYLAAGGWDESVFIWDVQAGELKAEIPRPDSIQGLGWSADSRYLASSVYDDIVVWDIQAELIVSVYDNGDVNGPIVWSNDGTTLAKVTLSKLDTLSWDADSRSFSPDFTYTTGGRFLDDIAWSPDDRYIAVIDTSDAVNAALVFERDNDIPLYRIDGHTDDLTGVTWSPDSRLLATSGKDPAVRIWDMQTGEQLYVFDDFDSTIWSLAWSPTSSRLVAFGGGDMVIWDIPLPE